MKYPKCTNCYGHRHGAHPSICHGAHPSICTGCVAALERLQLRMINAGLIARVYGAPR